MNIALIGLHGHYGVVLEGVKLMEDVNVTAVWDYDRARAEELARWDGHREPPKVYDDWRQLLDNEQIDIMCSNLYHNHQAEVLLECCKRGINLLPEKPLTYSWAEYEQVREAVEESGVFLSMLLTMRFEPQYSKIRQIVGAGQIGEVVQVTSQKSYKQGDRPDWQRDRTTFAGIIPFIGVHALDLIRWTSGREIVEVMAYHGNIGKPQYRDMQNQATVLALLDNGASASARLDFCRPAAAPSHGHDHLRVAGTDGIVDTERTDDTYLRLITHSQPLTIIEPQEVEPQLVNYVRALRGETQCVCPAEDVWRITEICLRARDAAYTGKPQKV